MGYRVLKQTEEKENFFTAFSADSLGCAYLRNGKLSQAREMHLKSAGICVKLYGFSSYTITTLNHLTQDFMQSEELPMANFQLMRVLQIHTEQQKPLTLDTLLIALRLLITDISSERWPWANQILEMCCELVTRV